MPSAPDSATSDREPRTGPVLAVFAHPDDAEIAAGGTIAGWTAAGREVHLLVLTNGDRGSSDPALRATVDRFEQVVITSISLNQLGTSDPPPLVRIALQGYLAFFAATLEGARTRSASAEEILPLLNETLGACLNAARD